MKRHKIVVALSVLLVISAALIAYNVHHHFAIEANRKAFAAQVQAGKAAVIQAQRQRDFNAELARLKAQCAKDHQVFISTKGKSPVGDCTSVNLAQ